MGELNQFAAFALIGLLAPRRDGFDVIEGSPEYLARLAFNIAEAMIAESEYRSEERRKARGLE